MILDSLPLQFQCYLFGGKYVFHCEGSVFRSSTNLLSHFFSIVAGFLTLERKKVKFGLLRAEFTWPIQYGVLNRAKFQRLLLVSVVSYLLVNLNSSIINCADLLDL